MVATKLMRVRLPVYICRAIFLPNKGPMRVRFAWVFTLGSPGQVWSIFVPFFLAIGVQNVHMNCDKRTDPSRANFSVYTRQSNPE